MSRVFFCSLTSVKIVMLFIIGIMGFSRYTELGTSTLVDFDYWKLRMIFLCFAGLSTVMVFSAAPSSVEPSGLNEAGAWMTIDFCLFELLFVCELVW